MAGLTLTQDEVQKLLGAASGDAALLFLYLRAGTQGHFDAGQASLDLKIPISRLDIAAQSLRQMGLYPEEKPSCILPTEAPSWSDNDIAQKLHNDNAFSLLVDEAQRRMGRVLSTSDLKVLLELYDYLGMSPEVISILLTFCIQKAAARGNSRRPSMRSVEQEGYRWAEQGIDTVEAAAAYMQRELERQTATGRIKRILQINDRNLTVSEQKYVSSWLDMGFSDDAIAMAYDRTCLNTGSMKWAYCNSILKSWASQGLLTADQIRQGDQKPAYSRQGQDRSKSNGVPGQHERDAVARLIRQHRNGGS